MSKQPVKFLYSIFLIALVSLKKLTAQVNADTSKLLAAVSKKTIEYRNVLEEANLVFPESLVNCKAQSLEYIKKFCETKRSYVLKTYQAGQAYFPKIAAILKQYELPDELKMMVALESGFSANAVSKAGAVGYWQMMEVAAREYGLKTSKNKDERRNFAKSTLAAARYLRDRSLNYNNDILLMVASYNCGIGTIRNALKKAHKTDGGFWDIKEFLPKETRNYVMNFIALNVIFHNYDNFVNGQILFAPKLIYIPFEATPTYNNFIPLQNVEVN